MIDLVKKPKCERSTSVHYVLDNEVVKELDWFCSETNMSKTGAVENAIRQYVQKYRDTGRVK